MSAKASKQARRGDAGVQRDVLELHGLALLLHRLTLHDLSLHDLSLHDLSLHGLVS